MLALIAAMTVAAVAAPDPTLTTPAAARAPFGKPFLRALGPDELAARQHCKDAVRLHTGYEPALLFRGQDKDAARARRLIDLPNGAFCLAGPAAATTGEGK